MSLIGIQKFIHSQIVKIENEIAINDYELKQIIPEAIEILKNNFANHACNEQEKEILNDIYKDIQILTKESKEHVLFDLKKKIKGIIRTGYFANNFSNVKKGSFENFKHWVSSNLDSIKQSLSLSIFNSFYSPYEEKKKYLNDQKKLDELTKLIKTKKLDLEKKELNLTENPKAEEINNKNAILRSKIETLESKKNIFLKVAKNSKNQKKKH
ncbi:MAG TPA: hypothetical protein PLC42_07155 [Parachlamydiaceae bacterium]|nr:hypothetical protein [Parachlamydiaceae bacterium]